jgi:hypothetical protein
MKYSQDFEESQHFSETFNQFAKGLAREIAQRCDVAGKHILEIGCGKGEFLDELCRIGGATGLGIDPGYRADDGRVESSENVKFINDSFGPKYAHLQADVILCRHTLEHIAPVAEFVSTIHELASRCDKTWVVFETPDAMRVLRDGAFWDIYYEHCSYFSAGTHARLFRQQGFDVTDLMLAYDAQYIVQYAKPAVKETTSKLALENDLDELRMHAEQFGRRVRESQQRYKDLVLSAYADGRSVMLWGGGSKAVSFLTTLGLGQEVQAAVDINPHKQGKFLPGTGHPIIAPEALRRQRPDLVVVMNPIYVEEVRGMLNALDIQPDIATL